MNNQLYYAHGTERVTVFDPYHKKPVFVYKNQINYKPLCEAINANDKKLVYSLLDEKQVLVKMSNGRITVQDDDYYLDGKKLHPAETKKLFDLLSEGATDIDRWYAFIKNLHANPSYYCREQAYNFIDQQGMCLTDEGHVIGYKGVRDDYKDKFSGKFSNHIGAELSMDRSEVDDNPNNGCSSGFHIGSHDYADNWAGDDGRLMVVTYNPADIVSVPEEHGYGKLRVSRYKVVDECHSRTILNNGAYGYYTKQTKAIWNHINELACGIEPYRIPIDRIQESYPDADTDLILSAVRNHSDYLASVAFDEDSNPSELILNS